MRILCAIQDKERQGWALAFQQRGDTFSFFDGKLSPHHVFHLFRPNLFIHNFRPLAKAAQNAAAKYGTVILDVDHYNLPICANTYTFLPQIYGGSAAADSFIAVFGDPSEKNINLINKISQKYVVRVFGEKRWPINEYCGMVNPAEFAEICMAASACLVLHGRPHVDHYHVCACNGNLISLIDGLEIGTPILTADDLDAIINSRDLYIQQMIDSSFVQQNRKCDIIPPLIDKIYEKETRYSLR